MDNKTVSVIIPVYNTGRQLEDCVNSLLRQTYKDLQIVLVNDASADESAEICKSFVKSDNKVFKYVEHETNKGQSITRNDGIRAASGKWMIFLDSDDTLVEDAIEKLVETGEREGVDVVFANYKTRDDDGVGREYIINLPEGHYTTPEFVSYFYKEISMPMVSCIGSKLYRMDFVKNKKEWTPDETITNYDYAFALDALQAHPSIYYLNKIVYIYYQHLGSITHSYRKNMYKGLMQARGRLMPLFKSCNCYEEKKFEFHLVLFSIIRRSLTQEVKYNKGYSSFKMVFDEIRSNPSTQETINVIRQCDPQKYRKFFLFLIRKGCARLVYFLCGIYNKR